MSMADRVDAVIATLSPEQRDALVRLHMDGSAPAGLLMPFLVRYHFVDVTDMIEIGKGVPILPALGKRSPRN